MQLTLTVLQFIVSIVLITIILLQSKGAGLGAGFGGGGGGPVVTTRRGVDLFLHKMTIVTSLIFFSLAIIDIFI